jgi:hypothetical protein
MFSRARNNVMSPYLLDACIESYEMALDELIGAMNGIKSRYATNLATGH